MFNFSTTTYINSAVYAPLSGNPGDINETPRFVGDATKGFKINHNTIKITKDTIYGDIYKKVGCVGTPDEVTIDLSKYSTADTTYRLALYIGLSMASQDSYYSNDLVFKGKPFYVEFAGGITAADFKSLIEKYQLLMCEKPLVKITISGTSVKITGVNAYQRFKKVAIENYSEDMFDVTPGVRGGFKALEDLTTDVVTGHEEFGTYYQLSKDNYLPTAEHRGWVANQGDEAPIPGALYNQYVVKMCVNRGVMGGDAVGELTKSLTTHVFWVKSDVCAAFETALKTGTNKTSIVEVDSHTDTTADTARNAAAVEHQAATTTGKVTGSGGKA